MFSTFAKDRDYIVKFDESRNGFEKPLWQGQNDDTIRPKAVSGR